MEFVASPRNHLFDWTLVGNKTPKGFHRSDFEEAWKRYLPTVSETAATVATSATRDRGNVAAVADVAACANGAKPIADGPSAVVPDDQELEL